MFITIGNITQYVPDMSAQVVLASGNAKVATVTEAAECVNRYVYLGDSRMNIVNDDFHKNYSFNQEKVDKLNLSTKGV